MRKLFTLALFMFAFSGISAGTADAGHMSYYDPYYYGGNGYYGNTAYVNGYNMNAYSYGYRDNYYRNDYYIPRGNGYDPYVWEDWRYDYYDRYNSGNYRGYDNYRPRSYVSGYSYRR